MKKKVYLEYKDKGNIVSGYFTLIKKTDEYVSIETEKNIIEIPRWKVLKLKERKDGK